MDTATRQLRPRGCVERGNREGKEVERKEGEER